MSRTVRYPPLINARSRRLCLPTTRVSRRAYNASAGEVRVRVRFRVRVRVRVRVITEDVRLFNVKS